MEIDRVSVLGTGAVGTAVARVLLGAGHEVTVWNRTAGRLADAVGLGARPADSAAAAAQASPLVVLCLTHYAGVAAVLDAIAPVLAGRTVFVLTTGTPDDARAAAAQVAGADGEYLDGGLQAAPADLGSATATVLVSGSAAVYDRYRDTLGALGRVLHVGTDPAAAALHDLVLFGAWYDAQVAVLRALATMRAAGTDPATFAAPLATQLGYVVDAVAGTAAELATGEHPRGPADLGEHLAVLDRLVALRSAGPLGSGGLDAVADLVRAQIAAGHGAEGLTRIAGLP